MRVRSHEGLPPRPYVPPSAAGAVGTCIAAATVCELAWRGFAVLPLVSLACMGALALGAIGMLARGRRNGSEHVLRYVRWLLVAIVLGSCAAGLFSVRMAAARDSIAAAGAVSTLSFVVEGDPSVSSTGISSTAKVLGREGRLLGCVRLSSQAMFEAGDVVRGIGTIDVFDEGDWERSRYLHGEVATVRLVRVTERWEGERRGLIGSVRARILRCIEPARSTARALMTGIVCGRTTELAQTDASDQFARTGLSHLVAVSGSHLAQVSGLIEIALRRLGCRRGVRAVALGIVMASYVVFTGGAPSAVRSLVMVSAALACGAAGRRGHAISGLALAVMLLVLVQPGVVFDLGFQLSAVSVLFIALFSRLLSYQLELRGLPRSLSEALALTLSAQWATIPIAVPVFESVSLIAPVANLVAGPVMDLLLVTGLAAAALCAISPALVPILCVPEGLANASLWIADVMSRIPAASVTVSASSAPLFICYAGAVLVFARAWRVWRARRLAALSGALLVLVVGWAVRWGLLAPAAVTVLDVGQADAILVRDGASTLLVDAGVDDDVVSALARQHVFRLDAIAITHWDRDHWGGLPDVLENFSVGRLLVAKGAAENVPDDVRERWRGAIKEIEVGDTLQVGGFTCRAVWPREPVAGLENADSLCLDVDYQGAKGTLSVLLTGDTERDQEELYAPDVGDIDVLKVGHHGSKVSVSDELLQELKPEAAIASAGEGNRYGHPSKACVEALEERDVTFFCTKDQGDITVFPGREGIRVDVAQAVSNR